MNNKPDVGRIVHFFDPSADASLGKGPQAAIIAHVYSDGLISLMVIDRHGNCSPHKSVKLLQPGADAIDAPHCQWPELQEEVPVEVPVEVSDEVTDEVTDEVADEVTDEVADEVTDEVSDETNPV